MSVRHYSEQEYRRAGKPEQLQGSAREGIKTVLREAINAGGTSLRNHIQPGGEIGYFVQELRVYGQAGKPCVYCGQGIKQIIQSGRSSFYCSSCQR